MTFLPVVSREFRVASRRRGTHWMRFLAALITIVVGFVILIGAAHNVPPHRLALLVFRAISLIGFGFCLLAGTFLTADCLCSERRDGTLGLLFLTDLRGYDVVLGKLAATSAVAVYAVLAILPMLGLPLLMGGVTPGEFGRMCLCLLVTLLVSLSSGMLVSATCRDTRTAMLGSFCIMLGLTGGVFLFGWIVWSVTRINVDPIKMVSPLGTYMFSFDAGRSGVGRFWANIGILSTFALAQLAVASFWLPRAWQESKPAKSRPQSWKASTHAVRARSLMLFLNPFTWLVLRDPFPKLATRAVLMALFLTWLGVFLGSYTGLSRRGEEWVVTAMFMAFGLHIIVKGLMAVQASRRFSEDRGSGVMELLMSTPLQPREILNGQTSALRSQFGWMLGLLSAINLLLVIRFLFPGRMSMGRDDAATFTLFLVGGIVLLFVDIRAIAWTSMCLGMRGLRHHRAVLGSLMRILIPPWAMLFLFVFLNMHGGTSREAVTLFFCVWAVLSFLISTYLGTRSKHILLAHFRGLAAGDPIREPDSIWPESRSNEFPRPPVIAQISRTP